ncbi:MAG: ABC transporter permease [Microcella sp.]
MTAGYARELLATRELLAMLVMREVRGQYRRTVLGQLWSIINPLATMLVYTVVFAVIFRTRPPVGDPSGLDVYALWLMCGLLPWLYLTRVVTGGVSTLTANAPLITKVYFPRIHLVLAVAVSTAITFGVELLVLSAALWAFGGFPLPWLPLVALAVVVLAMLASGLALMLSVLNVFFRDTEHFVAVLLPMWMLLTPIIYPVQLVEQALRSIGEWALVLYQLNPVLPVIEVFRALLYDNRLPDAATALAAIASASIVFVLGYLVFARADRRLAELL